jgi:hypothetical protein
LFWCDWVLNSGLHTYKTVALPLNHISSPFCSAYFGDRVSQTICLGWPWTMILPMILASQIARVIDMSHQTGLVS